MLAPFRRRPPHAARPAPVLGHGVWVGRRAVLRTGITIGHGAVIGAGAVVTRDVPPYAVVAGNPARILKFRFPDEVIQALLATRWFEHDFALLGRLDYAAGIDRQIQQFNDLVGSGAAAPLPPRTDLYRLVTGLIQASRAPASPAP